MRLTVALSNESLPPFSRWQDAIDDMDLLVRAEIAFSEGRIDLGCDMHVGGRRSYFDCVEGDVRTLPVVSQTGPVGRWSHAYGFGPYDKGWLGAITANIACLSYLTATGGALVGANGRLITDLSGARRELDRSLAGLFRLDDAYFARYPDERPTEPAGSRAIEVIVHRDG